MTLEEKIKMLNDYAIGWYSSSQADYDSTATNSSVFTSRPNFRPCSVLRIGCDCVPLGRKASRHRRPRNSTIATSAR